MNISSRYLRIIPGQLFLILCDAFKCVRSHAKPQFHVLLFYLDTSYLFFYMNDHSADSMEFCSLVTYYSARL